LKFKSVTIGTISKTKTVKIQNKSSKKSGISVSITSESTTAPFAVTNGCATTLAPGESCKVSVTFSPTDTTEQTGELTISDNETGAPQEVSLKGTGKEPKK
jgi:secreted trypsin-like serine protease